jgi:TonB family protein
MGHVAEPLPDNKQPARDLRFLVASEPWPRVFLQNLFGLFRSDEPALLPAESAAFWPDVFVDRALPWGRFFQSGAYHTLVLTMIWAGSRFLALQPHVIAPTKLEPADVIYYTPSEYLPPLDTRNSGSSRPEEPHPEYSTQPIISVPLEADNHSQTIVSPPSIQLHNDAALPNVVAWLERMPERMPGNPRLPIGPAPAVPASEISRIAPRMERSVIAPPPELRDESRTLPAPQAAVIAPPPEVAAGATRRPGDLNIGHSSVIAPAPQIALDEQRALPVRTSTALSRESAQVVAPPPSLGASGRSRSGGSMIALSLHPAVGAPPAPPAGNRRGTFASTPEGHRGASGAPGTLASGNSAPGASTGNGKKSGSASGKDAQGALPSGLYVGKPAATTSPVAGEPAPKNSGAYSVNPNLIANARPPRLTAHSMQSEGESKLSQEERAVFGNRKFYSLSLNMPNLNSAGGSWIIRFAALKSDSALANPSSRAASSSGASSGAPSSGELSAPSATRKVDPAYPLELMRQNVGGTVILYAVIHADGTVRSIRVLRSIDDQLDQYASEAVAKWQFQPATKNGAPVDVEATFWIPFRPAKVGSSF